MTSAALLVWQNDREPRLAAVHAQCISSLAALPPNRFLADEILRGYVILLSAHFQGYCRDLHTEASQAICDRVRPSLRPLVQSQFATGRKLDTGNPNKGAIDGDFGRLGIGVDGNLKGAANGKRVSDLGALNR